MTEIVHGEAVQISSMVRRVTAPNSSVMTGPGTNSYLLGTEKIAVVDPGPDDQSHIDALLAACDGRLEWIMATHTHPDHSPAARVLAEATGAVVMGNPLANDDGFQDESFAPQIHFAHNECFTTEEFSLRAIHTPGHVDNHLCFLVEGDGLLLTGDHIMQGSTVVIIPPHGDMKDYINSLQLLLDYPLTALGPGHGHIIDTPQKEIQGLIFHRLEREAKLVKVLGEMQQGNLDSLTPVVYDDVERSLHGIARYSLLAHLIKLEKESRVVKSGEQWIFDR